jgi:hypothetical protein
MKPQEQYVIGMIQTALATDSRIHKQDVQVAIRGERIHLTGQTSTEERRRLIETVVAEKVPEWEIRNEITVLEIAPPAQPETICA